MGYGNTKVHLKNTWNILLNYPMIDGGIGLPAEPKGSENSTKDEDEDLCDHHEYRSVIKLPCAANAVRFDISYIVLSLSRHLNGSRIKHLKAARRFFVI